MAGLSWEKAARRRRVRDRGDEPLDRLVAPPRNLRGISNDEARELARLQRVLGERYSGSGMTAVQAERAIRDARRRVGDRAR